MTWEPYIVKDFSGGMHDEWDDVDSKYCQRMRNMMLDINGKPYMRSGMSAWSAQTNAPVSGIKIIRDLSCPTDFQRLTALAYSQTKMAVSTGLALSESVGPTTWANITGLGTSYDFNYNSQDAAGRCKMQVFNQHVWCSMQDVGTYTTYLDFPKPRKIWPYGGQDNWTSANVGLPAYTDSGFNAAVGGGGGSATYIYAVVYKFVYKVNGVTFTVFGAPSSSVQSLGGFTVGSAAPIGSNTSSITALAYPTASTFHDLYPLSSTSGRKLFISLYRTTANGSVFFHVADISYNTTTYSDTTSDANLGAPLYTSDGTAAYDEPKPCKIMHIVGNYAYFGGFDIISADAEPAPFPWGFMGAIQSSPGVYDSAPGSFSIATPDHLTAIESVDYYPIFFTRYGCYRVEGNIDAYGNGSPVLRVISERVGALHQQLVTKADRGLIFAAFDGIYFTDGFSVKKLTDHLNKWYKTFFKNQNEGFFELGTAVYNAATKKFFIATCLPSSYPASVGSDNYSNALIVGDMNHPTEDGGVAVSYLDSAVLASTSNSYWTPLGLDSFKNTLFFGDRVGFVQSMPILPGGTQVDAVVGAGTSSVIYDYISASLDFGNRFVKKLVSRIYLVLKQPTNGGIPAMFAQIISYNDGLFYDDTHNTGDTLAIIQDSPSPTWVRLWRVMRRFASGHLRCFTKQVRITNPLFVYIANRPLGVPTYIHGTLNQSAKTFTDTTDAVFSAGMINMFLALSNDGYVTMYPISNVTGTTVLTVLDPGAKLPVNGNYDWMIFTYGAPLTPIAPGLGIDSFALTYENLAPGHDKAALPADAGLNQ